jgi:hypothetical protein
MSDRGRHESTKSRTEGRMGKLSKGAPGKNSRIKNAPVERLKVHGHDKVHDPHSRFRWSTRAGTAKKRH